jgi:heme exporter protein D
MELASHAAFIAAAYAAAALIVGAMIAWVVLDYASLKRALAGFEESGVTRRSDKAAKAHS